MFRKDHILVIDDSVNNQNVLKSILEKYGLSVVVLESADIAWQRIQESEESPRGIICDIYMQGMLGTEFLEKIKAHTPSIPVIMVTGESESRVVKEALDKGADGFVVKPLSSKSVMAQVQKYILKSA